MIGLILTVALLGQPQQPGVYRFQASPMAPGQYVHPQAAPPLSPVTGRTVGDPYGFTTWLNATRLMHGLGPLVYDPDLSRWAAWNNQVQRQQQRGEAGHFIMGPARRQNSAIITGDISPYLGSLWMASDSHRGALLDPSITRFGLAWDGMSYWTWNAR